MFERYIAACRLLNVSTHDCADVLFKANTIREGRTCSFIVDTDVLAWRSFVFSSFPLASSSFSRLTKRSAMPSKSFCVITPSLSKSTRWKYVFILRTQKSDMVAESERSLRPADRVKMR